MDNDVVISVENVTMAFNLNKEKVDNLKEYVIKLLRRQLEFKKFYALQDINFQVRRGQHLGILGLNGAGKSTLLKTIVGVYKPTEGTVKKKGVIAPLLYMLLGGAPLALTYKAINTMDSMLGYKNEKYLSFGRIPAKLDDAANYLPSRLAGLLWCAAAALTGNSAKGAWRIWRRDRRNHASPNSAQTESACAGALGVQLAGPAYYFGEYYPKPTIGDALRPIEPEDIRRANKMMYAESLLALLLGLAIRGVIL